jgi:hypothetical protein
MACRFAAASPVQACCALHGEKNIESRMMTRDMGSNQILIYLALILFLYQS